MNWLTSPTHHRWLEAETDRLLGFGARARDARGGFGWLRDDGKVDTKRDIELWITCRMTHVFSIADLMGRAQAADLADHGIDALRGALRDSDNGGWFAATDGARATIATKQAYGHAFVVLAAASATAAGRDGARGVLDEALGVVDSYFWDEEEGMAWEAFDADWSHPDPYRGMNANMHLVEAYLAAADVTGDHALLRRAVRVTERAIHGFARHNNWRLPEHFTIDWQPDLDYNRDSPAHPFRPFGATIGHLLEWSRLTIHAAASLEQSGIAAPEWMIPSARSLYATAIREGWNVDGAPGFVYTIDWEGRPVVRERMHWVAAEAIAAAAALYLKTRNDDYADDYRRWWQFAGAHHLDQAGGSWHHELDAHNSPSATVWTGKPDVYHAIQATLIPRLPLNPSIAPSVAAGNLDR